MVVLEAVAVVEAAVAVSVASAVAAVAAVAAVLVMVAVTAAPARASLPLPRLVAPWQPARAGHLDVSRHKRVTSSSSPSAQGTSKSLCNGACAFPPNSKMLLEQLSPHTPALAR
jgi:hypothetical protein